jgi:SNF2 family DNA or RNA helicase
VNFDILDEFYQIPVTRSKENIQKAYENSPMLQYIKDKKSLIIIDEAHRLSNSTSIRYKVIRDLIKRGEPHSIYAATGTPITNNPRNLYCVLQFLNDPITDDYNYYMERYCGAFKVPAKGEKEKWTNIWHQRGCNGDLKQFIRDNAKMIQVATDGTNLDELKERISHMYLRRTKEDFNDIVEKTIHEVFYDLSYMQQCEYDKLWEEYEEAKLNEDPEKELNKELLEGGLYRKYLSNQMVPNTISMTDDFIENNEKVVIACCYDEELYTLREYFGEKCVIYNGKMSLKEKDEAVRKFMNDNNTKIFIGNINAAGVGITLTSATKLIFNNISFVPGDNQQMCDRIHRLNQTKPVDIYYQLFRGTQYEKMWNIVLKKELIINQVIKKENEK